MNKKEFKKLIKKDKYQVLLFTSRFPLPYKIPHFAVHSWIVTANKGKIIRWEVYQVPDYVKNSKGYIYWNYIKPWLGIKKYDSLGAERHNSKLIGKIEGTEGSLAEKMVTFINTKATTYPFAGKYKYVPGPNSNTFVQWILNKFPTSGLTLPWNAFGKTYKVRK